jgi:hypothetical protein
MSRVVDCKCEALDSNSSTIQKKNKKDVYFIQNKANSYMTLQECFVKNKIMVLFASILYQKP